MDAQTLASLPPKLLAQYLRDPQALASQEMMQKGGDTSPVKGGWGEGLARMGQGLLGGLMAGKLREDYNTKAQGVADERAKAMAAAMGPNPNYMKVASGLTSPDNQELSNALISAQITRNEDQFKADQDPQKRLFKMLMDGRGGGQQFSGVQSMTPQGEIPPIDASGLLPPSVESNPLPVIGNQVVPPSAGIQVAGNAPPERTMAAPQPTQPMQPQGADALLTYALTGKMPEGYGITSDMKIAPLQGQQRKLSSPEQKELFDTMDLVNSGEAAQTSLNEANKVLNDPNVKPYSGFGAETIAAANRIPLVGALIDDKRATATTNIKNAVSEQALNQLKAIFGGMPTEGERQVLMDLQAMPSYSPQEQQMILNRALKAAETRLSYNRNKAQGIQTGGYKTMPIGQQPNTQDPLGIRQ